MGNGSARERGGFVDSRTGRATVIPWYASGPDWIDDRIRWDPPRRGFHTHPRGLPPPPAPPLGRGSPRRRGSGGTLVPPSGEDLVSHAVKAWPDRARLTTLVVSAEGTYRLTNNDDSSGGLGGTTPHVWAVLDRASPRDRARAVLDARWPRALKRIARAWNARLDAYFPRVLREGVSPVRAVPPAYAPMGFSVTLEENEWPAL